MKTLGQGVSYSGEQVCPAVAPRTVTTPLLLFDLTVISTDDKYLTAKLWPLSHSPSKYSTKHHCLKTGKTLGPRLACTGLGPSFIGRSWHCQRGSLAGIANSKKTAAQTGSLHLGGLLSSPSSSSSTMDYLSWTVSFCDHHTLCLIGWILYSQIWAMHCHIA